MSRLGLAIAIFLTASFQVLHSESAFKSPPAIPAPDVARAKQSIFSPESGVTLPAAKIKLLDTNHDGILTLEDLNGLGSSHSKWKTLFVAAKRLANAQTNLPIGSLKNPFILTEGTVATDGGFYDQIRRITFADNNGLRRNTEIIFLPGTYLRIQLLLRNGDSDSTENPDDPRPLQNGRPVPPVIDRFHPVRILLRSLYPLSHDPDKIVRFYGDSAGKDKLSELKCGPLLRLKSDAVDGANPMFLQIKGDNLVPHKSKISGIMVSGLNISCYRSGIDLLYAEKVVLKNNRMETLGSARTPEEAALPDTKTTAMYGTYAIGMARSCENILIKNNHITTTWNRYNSKDSPPTGDPGLMHPFYIINSGNVVYMDNKIENSSGPILKLWTKQHTIRMEP